jgi:DNA-binding transcriptional ArsR family regulator
VPEVDVFAALASPARRSLLRLLLDGPKPVHELAEHFAMSRPSVSEHLRLLRDAGLVSEQRDGRRRLYRLEAAPFAEVADWLTPYERFWRGRLASLADVLDDPAFDDPAFDDSAFDDPAPVAGTGQGDAGHGEVGDG